LRCRTIQRKPHIAIPLHSSDMGTNAIFEKVGNLDFDLSRSSEVKGQGRISLSIYEFLLVAHSNSGSIVHGFRDFGRYS
jgi:hypothetical protein